MTTTSRARVVGDYMVDKQIGSGSFSTVWHARHRVSGMEVAIKEIGMDRLSKKLQESLYSEIVILRQINHPNIIRLHDIIEVPGRIHLVLEYCRGGDLSMYVQRHGRVPETTAKHFMQQLAAGLKILRENNIVHRDLKPQNLLLTTNDKHCVLKIADFGFARSLQPRGLAETLCGSPLYMAPEIMQLQKYDAKADLWSVGAILFQLVTGNTPFTGNNQIQLLQNILKSIELRFPPDSRDLSSDCVDLCQKLLRRNPAHPSISAFMVIPIAPKDPIGSAKLVAISAVELQIVSRGYLFLRQGIVIDPDLVGSHPMERLTSEEFFNHPFLSQYLRQESLRSRMGSRVRDGFSLEDDSLGTHTEDSSHDDLPFVLDDDSTGRDGSPSIPSNRASMRSTYGFNPDKKVDKRVTAFTTVTDMGITHKVESSGLRFDHNRSLDADLKEPLMSLDQKSKKVSSRVMDSLEFIDQDYVLVSGPPMEVSSSSINASRPQGSSSLNKSSMVSAPMPIAGSTSNNPCGFGSLESHSSAPSGTSQGSMDMGDTLEQPSAHCPTRIRSLRQCASAVKELVNEKTATGGQLEALSIQLVILAIWKQALHMCHTEAASAIEGSPTQEATRAKGSSSKKNYSPDIQDSLNINDGQGPEALCSNIEREFLVEVGHAEELAQGLDPIDGSTSMPDAMETIFQSALSIGRAAAVGELMGDTRSAASLYSKAVRLLVFLLVEAPSLIINPPFCLTESDRRRLRTYIDILNNRQGQSKSQRMALLKSEDHH
ncbi:hypothetical protein GIB67_007752 [Kingdonia uniflora]|uniref:Protein kinase domain-containing protein n=1 Tax=Kingdonia uniflora TaxID=39325 RepID=A0A7J7N1P3_9MAGN|nr:hypothetical protein GIB67_007752 [Kingdonia uniflora]